MSLTRQTNAPKKLPDEWLMEPSLREPLTAVWWQPHGRGLAYQHVLCLLGACGRVSRACDQLERPLLAVLKTGIQAGRRGAWWVCPAQVPLAHLGAAVAGISLQPLPQQRDQPRPCRCFGAWTSFRQNLASLRALSGISSEVRACAGGAPPPRPPAPPWASPPPARERLGDTVN